MSVLVADCPRCGAERMTFDVLGNLPIDLQYDWQSRNELFCACRECHKATIFITTQDDIRKDELFPLGLLKYSGSLNDVLTVRGYISLRNEAAQKPPEHVPPEIKAVFEEAATCVAVECWNAAGAMFRTCIDLATRPLLPEGETPGLSKKIRRDLGLRLPWLFENQKLPADLRDLSTCIREDGNDGAHAGTLTQEDAADLLDFTTALLERIYTEPRRLELAKERRAARRSQRKSKARAACGRHRP